MFRNALIIVGIAGFVASCGGYTAPSNTFTPVPAGPNTVLVASGASLGGNNPGYVPPTLTVAAGTTVTWGNNDNTQHTTTADNGAWDSQSLDSGKTFAVKLNTPGTYNYHCTIHPFMHGTIVVQ